MVPFEYTVYRLGIPRTAQVRRVVLPLLSPSEPPSTEVNRVPVSPPDCRLVLISPLACFGLAACACFCVLLGLPCPARCRLRAALPFPLAASAFACSSACRFCRSLWLSLSLRSLPWLALRFLPFLSLAWLRCCSVGACCRFVGCRCLLFGSGRFCRSLWLCRRSVGPVPSRLVSRVCRSPVAAVLSVPSCCRLGSSLPVLGAALVVCLGFALSLCRFARAAVAFVRLRVRWFAFRFGCALVAGFGSSLLARVCPCPRCSAASVCFSRAASAVCFGSSRSLGPLLRSWASDIRSTF